MSDYLTEEERELKRLAEAATPGPWEYEKGGYIRSTTLVSDEYYLDGELHHPTVINDPNVFDKPEVDRPYIVAANPKAVLGLLETINRLRSQAEDEAYRQMEQEP